MANALAMIRRCMEHQTGEARFPTVADVRECQSSEPSPVPSSEYLPSEDRGIEGVRYLTAEDGGSYAEALGFG